AIIDEMLFQQVLTGNYGVDNVIVNRNCLEVTITSSGCNPNNWDMNFIASEIVVETLPVQYYTKIELVNNEACLAVFQKTVSFDLTPLQISGQNQVQVNISGWNTPIIYQ